MQVAPPAPTDSTHRAVASALLAVAGLALLSALGFTYWYAPGFHKLLAGLATPLPAPTRLFVATYLWWWLLLVPFAALALHILKRRRLSLIYAFLVSAGTVLCALALCAWMLTAVRLPMDAILKALD